MEGEGGRAGLRVFKTVSPSARFLWPGSFFFSVGPRGFPQVSSIGNCVLDVSRLGDVVFGGLFCVGEPGQT